MWRRLSIPIGLLAGVAVAALVLGGAIALAPDPGASPTPPPEPSATIAVASPSPSGGPTASADPSATAGPSAPPSPAGSAGPGALFHIGEAAPPLVVPQVGGGLIDLSSLKGTPVWVNFMGTYCPPCVDEFPLMNGFAARYADDGLVILAIDVKEDEGTVAAFAESLAATFPLGLDTDGSAQTRWDAIALPVHFWIDKDGIIRDGALGGIGPDIMARGVRSILPGVDVTP
jgi:thiol-disulfide isomerase/thioredoxin